MDQYSATYTIHHFQTDARGYAKMTSLMEWMQETAGLHAEQLGFSQQDLHQRGMLWALYRFSLFVSRMPKGGERLKFSTWVSSLSGPFSEREYAIEDENGQVVVKATSLWFAINAETRRPQAIGKIGKSEDMLFGPKAMKGPEKLPKSKDGKQLGSTHATYYDLDINRHVNNVRYVEMIMGAIAQHTFENHEIVALDVNYLNEIVDLHQPLGVYECAQADDHIMYALRNKAGEAITVMRIRWKAAGTSS